MIKKAWAVWKGGFKDGGGTISTETGALNEAPYGFKARFESGGKGTNPEELIGAAHAGCFSMALSLMLGEAGLTAETIETHAAVTLEKVGGGFEITSSHLDVIAKIPRGPCEIRGDCRQGQSRVPRVETPGREDYDEREIGDLSAQDETPTAAQRPSGIAGKHSRRTTREPGTRTPYPCRNGGSG